MGQKHKHLVWADVNEPALRSAVEACNDDVSIDDSWYVLQRRFESLQCFSEKFASVFPGRAQMKSDFSIVKAEKYDFRPAITDLSFEGGLHCKQFSMLAAF